MYASKQNIMYNSEQTDHPHAQRTQLMKEVVFLLSNLLDLIAIDLSVYQS